jgi:hypothetical protein
MSKPKFLYIDDETDASVEAIRDGFNDEGSIEVVVEVPKSFAEQKKYFIEKLNEYDGLILDLRLEGNMKLDVAYNAPTIAQEVRTLNSQTQSKLKARPIILCSTDEKMRATYNADKTSHDLFDYKFLKGTSADWPRVSKKLLSLATGYRLLNQESFKLPEIFGREDINNIDQRIVERFIDNTAQSYDYAHFVIKELFHHPGPLIKEKVLAARLGVDIEASKEAWEVLSTKIFHNAKFKGLFCDGWSRWWADIAITIFKQITGKRPSTVNAKERVDLLTEKLGIKGLIAAEPLPHCSSSDFWTICEGYKKPLDPLEGFKIFETVELKPWQETKYISLDAIVERVGIDRGLRPHVSEAIRIEAMKSKIK